MKKKKVQLFNQARGIDIDPAATEGSIVGVNLRWPNGDIVTEEDLARAPTEDDYPVTFWRLIQEVPPNVQALAEQAGSGLYVITGPGSSATREIEVGDLLTIANGDGVGANPLISQRVIRHDEPSAESSWVINHNLGREVVVDAFTPGGMRVFADVILASPNQAQVLFDSPMAGYAIIS